MNAGTLADTSFVRTSYHDDRISPQLVRKLPEARYHLITATGNQAMRSGLKRSLFPRFVRCWFITGSPTGRMNELARILLPRQCMPELADRDKDFRVSKASL